MAQNEILQGRIEYNKNLRNMCNEICEKYPYSYLTQFCNSLKLQNATKLNYVTSISMFFNYLISQFHWDISLSTIKTITQDIVDDYLESIKICNKNNKLYETSESYQANQLTALKRYFSFLYKAGRISINPTENIEPISVPEYIEVTEMSDESIEIVMRNLNNGIGTNRAKQYQKNTLKRDQLIFLISLLTGIRVSALVGISIDDIDFETSSFKAIDKGNKHRRFYLNDSTMKILKEWLIDREKIMSKPHKNPEQTDALFISMQGKRMESQTARAIVKKFTQNIPEYITPHKLRSTHACKLYNATNDIYLVANSLGHTSTKPTRRYTKINKEKQMAIPDLIGVKTI